MIGYQQTRGSVQRWLALNTHLWQQAMAIIGLLLISAYLARRAARVGDANLVLYHPVPLLILGGSIALVFLRWPQLGLLAVLPASLYVPFAIGTGTGTSLSAPVLLLSLLTGLWFLDMLVYKRHSHLIPSRPILPVILLVIVAVLAFAMGQLPWFPFAQPASLAAQVGGLSVFVLSAAAFLLVAHQIHDQRWLEYMTWLFLILAGIYMAGRLIPALGTRSFLQWGAHGSLLWVWTVSLAFSQALYNRDLRYRWRFALAALVVATFSIGWFQDRGWASGWAPPLVAAMAMIWLRSWRVGLALTVAGALAKLALDPALLDRLIAEDQYSIDSRWVAWEIVLGQIASVNPLLGLGPANYYHYTPYFPIWGWYVQFNSHNQYVDLLAQIGVLGLACFCWFAWAVGRLGWELRERVPEGFPRAYVYGALGGLAGMLAAGVLGDWILPFVYNVGLPGFRASVMGWLFLGGLVVLERLYVTEK